MINYTEVIMQNKKQFIEAIGTMTMPQLLELMLQRPDFLTDPYLREVGNCIKRRGERLLKELHIRDDLNDVRLTELTPAEELVCHIVWLADNEGHGASRSRASKIIEKLKDMLKPLVSVPQQLEEGRY